MPAFEEERGDEHRRTGAGIAPRDLRMPDFRAYAAGVSGPGARDIGDTHVLGRLLRDVEKLNREQRNFRIVDSMFNQPSGDSANTRRHPQAREGRGGGSPLGPRRLQGRERTRTARPRLRPGGRPVTAVSGSR